MTSSSHDAPSPAPPFSLDRDLLDRNLEVKRAEGFPCPHCSQTMEWNLGSKTKGAIMDALAQGNFHEAFFFCDKDDCPSVQRDGNDSLVNPFVRRISAADDGTITIETFPLEKLLTDVAYFRQLSRVATRTHMREIDELRREFERRLGEVAAETAAAIATTATETRRADEASRTLGARNGELEQAREALRLAEGRIQFIQADQARQGGAVRDALQERIDELSTQVADAEKALEKAQEENRGLTAEMEEKGRKLGEARQDIERLEGLLAEMDRVIGAKKPEDRLAIIQEHARTAMQMEEVHNLTGQTPGDVLEKSRTWAAKQKKGRR